MVQDKTIKFLWALVITLLLVLAVLVFVNFNKISDSLSGYATVDYGYVNVTVSTQIAINMTRDTINWGAGSIDPGRSNATLSTSGESATVVGGSWSTTGIKGFILENVGTVNASLTLQAGKTAATFFGGTAGDQRYQWNVTNKEAGACNATNTEPLNVWRDVNQSAAGTFCARFGWQSVQDEIYIDLLLSVPVDTPYMGGAIQSDTITATASSALN